MPNPRSTYPSAAAARPMSAFRAGACPAGAFPARARVAAATCALLVLALAGAPRALAGQQLVTSVYSYTGAEQTFTVPSGVYDLQVAAIGGQGGDSGAQVGGNAAKVTAELAVMPGQTLFVEVGGHGGEGSRESPGGFNGGAAGAGGGGGASDIRTAPRVDGLLPEDRLIVAGGGGGAGASGACGGAGGGLAGNPGHYGRCGGAGGGAATFEQPGAAGNELAECGAAQGGRLGEGGAGGHGPLKIIYGGGGGGGYYGGGGGGVACGEDGGGGGGGSSTEGLNGHLSLAPRGTPAEVEIRYLTGKSTQSPRVESEEASPTSGAARLTVYFEPEPSEVFACAFEYGPTPALGLRAPCSSYTVRSGQAIVEGLAGATTYYYRAAVADPHGGVAYGELHSFESLAVSPAVATGMASSVTATSVTLHATVNPEGGEVPACSFEYGASAYSSGVTCTPPPGAGIRPVAVTAVLTGLAPATTYKFRVVAINAAGKSTGGEQVFTTATSSTKEELPEFGRCAKLAQPTGRYADAGCTTESAGQSSGDYEWESGPGGASGFTFANGAATLEAAGGKRIVCARNTYSGQYTGPKAVDVEIGLSGCETANPGGISCEAAGAQVGEIPLRALEGRLGFVRGGGEPLVGLALHRPLSGSDLLAEFTCGEERLRLSGALIAPYAPVDRMAVFFEVPLSASDGHQQPSALEGGAEKALALHVGEAAPEPIGLLAEDVATNQEALEIKATP